MESSMGSCMSGPKGHASRKILQYESYGTAIICALEVEMSAVRYMLDEEHERAPRKEGDSNRYICGRMGNHNVVISYLPSGSQGIGAAAVVATDMKRTFPGASLRLMVGIGGGVPIEQDIRLGDVVISMPSKTNGGVVQYDLGTQTVSGFERKGFLLPLDPIWRTALVEMQSDHRLQNNRERISQHINTMIEKHPDLQSYHRPQAGKDLLFLPEYEHVSSESTCQNCDRSKLVVREAPSKSAPTIFYGLIASGNQVVKDAGVRNRIAKDAGGALCLEMEAAGLMNDFRCVVIRGISDYADSHKNNDWHEYAAAVAAACARELLTYVEPPSGAQKTHRNKHWTINRPKNTYFTGRQDIIRTISSAIRHAIGDVPATERCCIVITGMGGQGKSEICLRVADVVRQEFWGVFWVDVGTVASAQSGFAAIANRLNTSGSGIDNVLQLLANTIDPWLLILDNADDGEFDYQEYFPTGSNGVILLTSRNPECSCYAAPNHLALEGLPDDDAVTLLLKSAGKPLLQSDDGYRGAEAVATSLLQGHPLALIQAGAYISHHCSIIDYSKVFERQRKRLLTYRPRQANSRHRDVYATFEASAAQLQASSEDAAGDALELLEVISMLAASELPLSLFEAAWQGAQDISSKSDSARSGNYAQEELTDQHTALLLPLLDLGSQTWDTYRLNEAIRFLESYSLLSTSGEDEKVLTIHPLIHAWAKDRQTTEQQQHTWIKAASFIAVAGERIKYWERHQRVLRPHLPALLLTEPALVFTKRPRLLIMPILIKCGWQMYRTRLNHELYKLGQQTFDSLNLKSQEVDKNWLSLYELVTANLRECGHLQEAVELSRMMVKVREQATIRDELAVQRSQQDLAGALLSNGQVQQAVTILEQVVRVRERRQEPTHPNRLLSQHILGMAYLENGQCQKAITILERVVGIKKERLAEDDPELVGSQHVLGIAYLDDEQTKPALELLEHVDKMREKVLPPDHPDRIATQHMLAMACGADGQTLRAVELLERTTKLEGGKMPEDDLDLLKSQHELARAYVDNGQVDKGVALLERVIELRNRTEAANLPEQIISQYELARVYHETGRLNQALHILQQAVRTKIPGEPVEHMHVLSSQRMLAIVLWDLDKRENALQLLRKTVEQYKRKDDPSSLHRQRAEEWLEYMESEMQATNLDIGNLSVGE